MSTYTINEEESALVANKTWTVGIDSIEHESKSVSGGTFKEIVELTLVPVNLLGGATAPGTCESGGPYVADTDVKLA